MITFVNISRNVLNSIKYCSLSSPPKIPTFILTDRAIGGHASLAQGCLSISRPSEAYGWCGKSCAFLHPIRKADVFLIIYLKTLSYAYKAKASAFHLYISHSMSGCGDGEEASVDLPQAGCIPRADLHRRNRM